MRLLTQMELYSLGVFETTYQYGHLSVGLILKINYYSIILYIILICYVNTVWPLQYGIIKPWYFPLNPILNLLKCRSDNEKPFEETKTEQTINVKYFEEEQSKNRIKISIQNLFKKFGKKTVVSNINLNIYENQLTALLGENGAGKTTLMNIITGLCPPTKGKILIDDYDIKKYPKKARKSISLCPQHNIL